MLVGRGVLASSNVRGGDAAACFDGMNAALAESKGTTSPRLQGKILARAPGPASCEIAVLTESFGDMTSQPAAAMSSKITAAPLTDLPISQRWRVIVDVVLGRGTGAPQQIGVILVSMESLSFCLSKHIQR